MSTGLTAGNPFIEGEYPCTNPEIVDVNCEDCPIYPDCARERNGEIPQDEVPFPGANLEKNFNFIAGRVLLNLGINDLRTQVRTSRIILNGNINIPVVNHQYLDF